MTDPLEQCLSLDQQLQALLQQRFELSQSLTTEQLEMLRCRSAISQLPQHFDRKFHQNFTNVIYQLTKAPSVAFFGTTGSYTSQAAMEAFGPDAQYQPCSEIGQVFDLVSFKDCDFGVVPVENSTEGVVTRTLDLLTDSAVKITGEVALPITHNLLSQSPLSAIKKVCSHPQALAQCQNWLLSHLPGAIRIEVANTTEAARLAAEDPETAGIASTQAAEAFNLTIQAAHIEDIKGNTTRFMIISNQDLPRTGDDKTSLLLSTNDSSGALYQALKPFKELDISMTMIQSRPSKRKTWEYLFFIDYLGHITDDVSQQLLDALHKHCHYVKVLGSYPRAAD